MNIFKSLRNDISYTAGYNAGKQRAEQEYSLNLWALAFRLSGEAPRGASPKELMAFIEEKVDELDRRMDALTTSMRKLRDENKKIQGDFDKL